MGGSITAATTHPRPAYLGSKTPQGLAGNLRSADEHRGDTNRETLAALFVPAEDYVSG